MFYSLKSVITATPPYWFQRFDCPPRLKLFRLLWPCRERACHCSQPVYRPVEFPAKISVEEPDGHNRSNPRTPTSTRKIRESIIVCSASQPPSIHSRHTLYLCGLLDTLHAASRNQLNMVSISRHTIRDNKREDMLTYDHPPGKFEQFEPKYVPSIVLSISARMRNVTALDVH